MHNFFLHPRGTCVAHNRHKLACLQKLLNFKRFYNTLKLSNDISFAIFGNFRYTVFSLNRNQYHIFFCGFCSFKNVAMSRPKSLKCKKFLYFPLILGFVAGLEEKKTRFFENNQFWWFWIHIMKVKYYKTMVFLILESAIVWYCCFVKSVTPKKFHTKKKSHEKKSHVENIHDRL